MEEYQLQHAASPFSSLLKKPELIVEAILLVKICMDTITYYQCSSDFDLEHPLCLTVVVLGADMKV